MRYRNCLEARINS